MNNNLSEFELEIIRRILESEKPEYVSHIKYLQIVDRKYTGHGQFTHIIDHSLAPENSSYTLGQKVWADLNGLEYGVGFALYIDKGLIGCLEVFSLGSEEFPEHIAGYKIYKK